MASSNKIKKHVVTKGDLCMAEGGKPLYECPVPGGKIYYNVIPGQLVAYTEGVGSIPMTVNAATLSPTDIYELNIGVGIDTNGDGAADQIRLIGSDHISGCLLDEVSVSPPACGVPEIKDFLFDCTKCDETYSVKVTVDDNSTRSYAPAFKSAAEFVGSVVTECHSCGDCSPEHNCKEVACKLADALNNDRELKINGKLYPDWKQGRGVKPPFRAVRLHERSVVYCLVPTAKQCSCDGCNSIDAITSFVVNGETITLTGTTDPADGTRTLVAQLDRIATSIERKFESEIGPHSGSAYITKGTGNCCSIQLHINTCDTTFEIPGLTPCHDDNPFKEYTKESTCVDCGDEAETYKYNCGIRIIAEPIELECNCYMEQPQSFLGRKIEVCAIGNGWSHGSTKVQDIQCMELPAGLGSQIQWLEYSQMPGGKGRNYRASSPRSGWFGLPAKDSRISAAPTADCSKMYCSYTLNSRVQTEDILNKPRFNKIHSGIHIPVTDTTTKTCFEEFFNKLLELSPGCRIIGPVSCDNEDSDSGSGDGGVYGVGAGCGC